MFANAVKMTVKTCNSEWDGAIFRLSVFQYQPLINVDIELVRKCISVILSMYFEGSTKLYEEI